MRAISFWVIIQRSHPLGTRASIKQFSCQQGAGQSGERVGQLATATKLAHSLTQYS